jgi:hypothetical protein
MALEVKYAYRGLTVKCDPSTTERMHDLIRSEFAIAEPKPTEPVRFVAVRWRDEMTPQHRWSWIGTIFYGIGMTISGGIMIALLYAGCIKWHEWLSAWFA